MNVVLQSFNNISHFCEYLTQMPSLEGIAFNETPTHRGRIVAPGRAKELSDALLAEELRKVIKNHYLSIYFSIINSKYLMLDIIIIIYRFYLILV